MHFLFWYFFDRNKDTTIYAEDLTIATPLNCSGFSLTLEGKNIQIQSSVFALNAMIHATEELIVSGSSVISISSLFFRYLSSASSLILMQVDNIASIIANNVTIGGSLLSSEIRINSSAVYVLLDGKLITDGRGHKENEGYNIS